MWVLKNGKHSFIFELLFFVTVFTFEVALIQILLMGKPSLIFVWCSGYQFALASWRSARLRLGIIVEIF